MEVGNHKINGEICVLLNEKDELRALYNGGIVENERDKP